MARPSKFIPERRFGVAPAELLESMHYLVDDEESAVRQLRFHLLCEELHLYLKVPLITGAVFEYRFPKAGIADLVLLHGDGGVTIVEAKRPGTNRDLVTGIGQLFLYEAAMWEVLVDGCRPAYIHKILCAPVHPGECVPTVEACRRAGVRYVPLIPSEHVRRLTVECAGGVYGA